MIDKDCIFNQDCITGMKDIPDGGGRFDSH